MFCERIACLRVKGCGLIFSDRSVLDAIAVAASGMLLGGDKKQKIKADVLEGLVTNHSKVGILGMLVGYVFTIEIETDEINRVTMDFVLTRPLDEQELKHTFWSGYMLNEDQEKAGWN